MTHLESLPESWLRQLVQVLPVHLKLKLRCCSRKLQGYVDELGVGLTVVNGHLGVHAVELAAQHLTSLNTLHLVERTPFPHPSQEQHCNVTQEQHLATGQMLEPVASYVQQRLPNGFPALRKLVVSPQQQPQLCAAVLASRPPLMRHLKLADKPRDVLRRRGATAQTMPGQRFSSSLVVPEHVQHRCSILLQLPALLPNLTCLEIDHETYTRTTDIFHAVLSQPLPHLDSLILHPPMKQGEVVNCAPVIQQPTWTAVFEPLLSTLTRLDIGSRAVDADSSQNLPAAAAASPAADEHPNSHQSQSGLTASMPEPALQASSHSTSAGVAAGLGQLLELTCCGLDGPVDESWCLTWVSSCCNLTALHIRLCSAGELDCDVLAQLQQLQLLSLHYYKDEFVSSAQLAPLSVCSRLTQLKLDALLVELPAAAAAAAAGSDGNAGVTSNTAAPGYEAAAPAEGGSATMPSIAAAAAGSGVCKAASRPVLPQLTSLQRLTANLLCKAPLSTLAPQLTRLSDNDFDLATLDLPRGFIDDHPPAGSAPLVGLTGLQVLGANIFGLVRHAIHPLHLSSLRELHVEMVGSLEGSCLDPEGLPCLPHLTRLVLTIDTKVHTDLSHTYAVEEDALVWCNQSTVRLLRLKGSALLGGFLVVDCLLQQLHTAMPGLESVELVKLPDLTVQQLRQLVQAHVCRHVLVQGCRGVTDRDCVELEQGVGGSVAVEYSL